MEDSFHDSTLTTNVNAPLPGQLGSASSQIDGTQLMASIHATGLAGDMGDATANAFRRTDPSNDFRALATGSLTITIPYLLAHAGVPTLSQGIDFHATASGQLVLFNLTAGNRSIDNATLSSLSGNGATERYAECDTILSGRGLWEV